MIDLFIFFLNTKADIPVGVYSIHKRGKLQALKVFGPEVEISIYFLLTAQNIFLLIPQLCLPPNLPLTSSLSSLRTALGNEAQLEPPFKEAGMEVSKPLKWAKNASLQVKDYSYRAYKEASHTSP